jgi:hypothetical protein
MRSFLQRHAADVIGTLSGFDRVRVRGTLRLLSNVGGMGYFMDQIGVKLKGFGRWVNRVSGQVKAVTQQIAKRAGRPPESLPSCHTNKEAAAFGLRWIVDVLRESGVPVERFVATGGLPHHNPLVVDVYADVLGEPITVAACNGARSGDFWERWPRDRTSSGYRRRQKRFMRWRHRKAVGSPVSSCRTLRIEGNTTGFMKTIGLSQNSWRR